MNRISINSIVRDIEARYWLLAKEKGDLGVLVGFSDKMKKQ